MEMHFISALQQGGIFMRQFKIFFSLLTLIAISTLFIACPPPKEVVPTKMEITTQPSVTEYIVGSNISTQGMVIKIFYSDDTTKDFSDFSSSEWQIIGFDSRVPVEGQQVTISYTKDGTSVSATFLVNIKKDEKFDSIEVFTNPTKVSYVMGELLDPAGLVLKIVTTGEEPIYKAYAEDDTNWTFTGFSSDTPNAALEVTVTYDNGFASASAVFTVEIRDATITSAYIDHDPDKTDYFIGEELNLNGLIVRYTLSDTTELVVSNFPKNAWLIEGFENGTPSGKTTITLSRRVGDTVEVVGTFDVSLVEIGSFTISGNYETTYFPGEDISKDGMVLTARIQANDGTDYEMEVSPNDEGLSITGFDSSKSGTGTVEINFTKGKAQGFTSFSYNVVKMRDFTNTPTVLSDYNGSVGIVGTPIDAISDENGFAAATYISFGDYPQTVVKETDLKENGGELIIYNGNDDRQINRGGVNFIFANDGNYYVRELENAKDTSKTYSDGSTMKNSTANSYRYFKVEPIIWRVMDKDYNGSSFKMLHSEKVLDAINYSKSGSDQEITSGNKVYPNNYKYSNVRAFLNGKKESDDNFNADYSTNNFINIAFSLDAAALLKDVLVKNDYESAKIDYYENNFIDTTGAYTADWFDDATLGAIIYRDGENNILGIKNNAPGANSTDEYSTYKGMMQGFVCDDTTDKVFLLSIAEQKWGARYGFTGEAVLHKETNEPIVVGTGNSDAVKYTADVSRKKIGSDYAYARKCKQYINYATYATRSPQWASSMKRKVIALIPGSGTLFDVYNTSEFNTWIARGDSDSPHGISPAICIDFNID